MTKAIDNHVVDAVDTQDGQYVAWVYDGEYFMGAVKYEITLEQYRRYIRDLRTIYQDGNYYSFELDSQINGDHAEYMEYMKEQSSGYGLLER